MHVRVCPPSPLCSSTHLASVASSSSSQISGLWRRCRPGYRCTVPASCRGFSAAGEQSVGGRVAPSPAASVGSNHWRLPLPCLRRNSRHKHSLVSVRVSSLLSCVHRNGPERSQNQTQTSSLRYTGYRDPILQPQRGKVPNKHSTLRYSIFSVIVISLAIYLKRTEVYLPVTFHRAVCQSDNSSCH